MDLNLYFRQNNNFILSAILNEKIQLIGRGVFELYKSFGLVMHKVANAFANEQ